MTVAQMEKILSKIENKEAEIFIEINTDGCYVCSGENAIEARITEVDTFFEPSGEVILKHKRI